MSAAVSLEVAIRAKYCAIEERDASPTDALPKSRDAIKESALTYRPGDCLCRSAVNLHNLMASTTT